MQAKPNHTTGSTTPQRGDVDGLAVIDLDNPSAEILGELATVHGLHELAVEDALEAHFQRPKLERFEDGQLSLVLKTVTYDDEKESLRFGEVLLLIGADYVITVRHGDACRLPPTAGMAPAEPASPLAYAHALLDVVTDEYEPVMDAIEVDLYQIEADVFSPERTNPAQRIYRLKREVLALRRNVSALVRPVTTLARDHYFAGQQEIVMSDDLRNYFGDVEDHLRIMMDRIAQANALLSEVLDANLAQIGVQQNADMRRMTAWAVLFLVPTLLAGVWGMNFAHMPELDWTLGYPLALLTMAVVTGYAWWRLKRANWL